MLSKPAYVNILSICILVNRFPVVCKSDVGIGSHDVEQFAEARAILSSIFRTDLRCMSALLLTIDRDRRASLHRPSERPPAKEGLQNR